MRFMLQIGLLFLATIRIQLRAPEDRYSCPFPGSHLLLKFVLERLDRSFVYFHLLMISMTACTLDRSH